MNDTNNRLRALIQKQLETTGLSQVALAKYIGVSPSAVSRILSGSRQISATELIDLKNFFDLSYKDFAEIFSFNFESDNDLVRYTHKNLTDDIKIDSLSIKPYDEDKGGIALPSIMLNSVKVDRIDYLRWLRIFDDAMSPTLERGDVIVIDFSNKAGVGLYAIEIAPEQVSVRRVDAGRWDAGDLHVHIAADNPKFRSYETPLQSLKVIGAVLVRITTHI